MWVERAPKLLNINKGPAACLPGLTWTSFASSLDLVDLLTCCFESYLRVVDIALQSVRVLWSPWLGGYLLRFTLDSLFSWPYQ